MTKKVYIDAGHGGKDAGAVGNGLKEKDLTLKISLRLADYLKNNYENVEVKLSRTGDTYPSLSQRAHEANVWGADLFVSEHINAGGGTGIETLIHKGLSLTSTTGQKATLFNNHVIQSLNNKKYNIRNRGVKNERNIAVLRETKMTAILPETLFIDNKNDANLLKQDKFINDVVQAHAEGIALILNLKKKKNTYLDVSVKYNGKSVTGFIENGTTYVQLRELANLLHIPINYNATSKTVTFNGKTVPAKIVNGRSYLPVRLAANIVGLKVHWDQQTKTVTLYK